MITKKDLVALAAALRAEMPVCTGKLPLLVSAARHEWICCVYAVANVCHASNPAFKRATFYTACGIQTLLTPTISKSESVE